MTCLTAEFALPSSLPGGRQADAAIQTCLGVDITIERPTAPLYDTPFPDRTVNPEIAATTIETPTESLFFTATAIGNCVLVD